jgi:hypothetical protein
MLGPDVVVAQAAGLGLGVDDDGASLMGEPLEQKSRISPERLRRHPFKP